MSWNYQQGGGGGGYPQQQHPGGYGQQQQPGGYGQQQPSYHPQYTNAPPGPGYPPPGGHGGAPPSPGRHPIGGNFTGGPPAQYGQYNAQQGGYPPQGPPGQGYGPPGGGYGAPSGYGPPGGPPGGGYGPPGGGGYGPPGGGYGPPGGGYGQPGGYGAPPPGGNYGPPPPGQGYGGGGYQQAPDFPYYLGVPCPTHRHPPPPSLPGYEPSADLDALLKATEGIGTREAALTRVLSKLSPAQLSVLSHAYRGRKGKSMVDMLKSETSGYYGQGIEALALGPARYDAHLVRSACRGPGTDEKVLTEVLLGRTPDDLRILRHEFHHAYGQHLDEVVLGDLSMKTKRMFDIAFAARVETWGPHDTHRVDADAKTLKDALKSGRTDEMAVCSIVLGRTPAYLQALNESYRRVTGGTTLTKSIKKHFSGHMESGLLQVVEGGKRDSTGAWRDAKRLEAAMKGMGTKDEQLVYRVVRMHWNPQHREAVKNAYRQKYGKDLLGRVRGETSGDYCALMCALISPSN